MFPDYVTGNIEDTRIETILLAKFPYYRKLDHEQKELFRGKLQQLLVIKKFVPRQEMLMTDEVRVLIAGCAVQLTLGLKKIEFSQFEYILVYPQEYQNPMTKNYHRGETNLAGFMCLSYKDILLGLSNEHDNFNLGLHEFSHALRLNSFKGEREDEFFDIYFPKMIATGVDEYYRIKSGRPSIFRKYGGANLHEFFPVIVEHWFENPAEFKAHHPDLFEKLSILLNQEVSETTVRLNTRTELLRKNSLAFTGSEVVFATALEKGRFYTALGLILTSALLIFAGEKLVFPAVMLGIIGGVMFLKAVLGSKEFIFYNLGFRVKKNLGGNHLDIPYKMLVTSSFEEATGGETGHPLGYANKITLEFINDDRDLEVYSAPCKLNFQQVGLLRDLFLKNQVNVLLNGFHSFAEKGSKTSSKS